MLRKIDEAYQKALSGIVLDKQEIIDLLSVPVGSDECAYLCRKANEAAHVLRPICGGRSVWITRLARKAVTSARLGRPGI